MTATSVHISPKWFSVLAWSLSLSVAAIAFIAWGSSYAWHILPFNTYVYFPVLGLLAWSIMWSHYINGFFRDKLGIEPSVLKRQFQYTGYIVLGLICLHPGLLIYQRFKDGFGLPPHSYESYVAPGLGWVTLIGTASLFVFLAFELRRWFGNRPWWHYVVDAGDFAMLAIFYHSLRLGIQLRTINWFRYLWWFYGACLTLVLIRKYYLKYINRSPANKKPA